MTNNNAIYSDCGTQLKDSERQPCEIYLRIMGYIRPVSEWNKGKKQEFADRKYMKETALGRFRTKENSFKHRLAVRNFFINKQMAEIARMLETEKPAMQQAAE